MLHTRNFPIPEAGCTRFFVDECCKAYFQRKGETANMLTLSKDSFKSLLASVKTFQQCTGEASNTYSPYHDFPTVWKMLFFPKYVVIEEEEVGRVGEVDPYITLSCVKIYTPSEAEHI
jgi:hypothetical protein